jgi:hypothetical protein
MASRNAHALTISNLHTIAGTGSVDVNFLFKTLFFKIFVVIPFPAAFFFTLTLFKNTSSMEGILYND